MSAERATAATPGFRLNLEEALRAIYKDPDWLKKLAIGALCSFLSLFVVGTILTQGYLLLYGERVARAEPRPLPEWDDLGAIARRGLIGLAVGLVYTLPLIALGFLFALFIVPFFILAANSGGGSGAASGILGLTICGGFAVFFPLALLLGVISLAAQAQLILHEHDLGAAFRLRAVWGFIRRNPGQYALMILLSFVANAFLSQIGQLACFVGIFVTTFVAQLFQYHLLGQLCWHERATGEATAMPAPEGVALP